MMFFKLSLISLVVFIVLDLLWLGIIAKKIYQEQIGFLLNSGMKWQPAILFYCLYSAALVFFAIMPALREGNWVSAVLYGGFLGLTCYGTYEFTNWATLRGWPIKIVAYDLLWGTFISAVTSVITFWMATFINSTK